MSEVCFHAVGRRKKAIARVRLIPGEGNIVINWSQGATVLDSPDPQSEDDTLHSVNATKPQPADIMVVIKPRG